MKKIMTPIKKAEIAKFKRFLLENKAFSIYKSNLDTPNNTFLKEYDFSGLNQFLIVRPQEDFLAYAFNWAKTKQGHDFWENLDFKWRRRIDSLV
jgi:hypothetical protein